VGRKKKDHVQETDTTVSENQAPNTDITAHGETKNFKSPTKGKFALPGIEFEPGKTTPVPEEIQGLKKFKHAVELGVLVKA